MTTMTSTAARNLLAAALLYSCFSAPSAAAGGVCANLSISTRGEVASFQWLAKTKARANWRARVRATKSLGEAYSSWTKAKGRTEACDNIGRGIVCTFSGTPCQR